ncbi:SAM-dependent RNA methyltransferase [Microdochium trichocladiopsis]|uniref:SAM-dependent RNA methyltransferase n=1 Tax=Microdochium trichocladiopsis TaxID=1682393 RepID=A0A9P8Y0U7_9PEZI|nr:SAM-dependent RNA methyltransferase [Microdochium trichocladiopsis]KAH7026421.1 SAM-dependent RNA methyltransferase [Microdochium trichocladiopsis]
MASSNDGKTYIVEHLDPELGPWSELEYICIGQDSQKAGSRFLLSSLPDEFRVPERLGKLEAFTPEKRSVEEIAGDVKNQVCLLDPAAKQDLSPEDGKKFGVFLFGGILGDDPPRDRTSELRKKGYEGRRLGPVQMTTDTAVRVTRMVVQEGYTLETVPYLDHPDIKFNEHESTQMPFRYVADANGKPIMPEGMVELIGKDADKTIDDMF